MFNLIKSKIESIIERINNRKLDAFCENILTELDNQIFNETFTTKRK